MRVHVLDQLGDFDGNRRARHIPGMNAQSPGARAAVLATMRDTRLLGVFVSKVATTGAVVDEC